MTMADTIGLVAGEHDTRADGDGERSRARPHRDRRQRVRRPRHGDPPQGGRDRGLRRARARRRRRRHVAGEHLSRLPVRRPLAPVLVLLRAEPGRGRARTRASRRSGRTCAAAPSATASRRHLRFGHELTGATWDEARAPLARRDDRAAAVVASLLIDATGPLSQPATPRDPRPGAASRARSSTPREWDHDHDLDGERVAVIGTGASAIQFVPRIQPKVGRLHVFQRTAPWIMPHSDRPTTRFERQLYRARAAAAARSCARASTGAASCSSLGFAKRPTRWRSPPSGSRALHLRRQVRDPRAAPQARARLPPRLQARADLQRLVSGADAAQRRARHRRRSRRSRAARSCSPTAARARSTRSSSAPASTSPTRRRRWLVRGRGGKTLAEAAGDEPAGLPRHGDARLPEPLPDHRPEHRPRPQLDGLHDRVAADLRHGRDPPDGRARDRERSRCARRPSRQFNAELQRDDARHRLGDRAARAGTSTRAGATRRCGRTSRSASASARAASTPTPTSCASRVRRAGGGGAMRRPPFARAPFEVAGRTVFVTGAARGIGAASRAAARARARTSRSSASSPSCWRRWPPSSATARSAFEADVTDLAALERAVPGTVARFGAIDVAIANAGISYIGRLATAPVEQVERALEVNLMGVWRTNRAVIGQITEQPRLPAERRLAERRQPHAADGALHGVQGGRRGADGLPARRDRAERRARRLRVLRLHRHRPRARELRAPLDAGADWRRCRSSSRPRRRCRRPSTRSSAASARARRACGRRATSAARCCCAASLQPLTELRTRFSRQLPQALELADPEHGSLQAQHSALGVAVEAAPAARACRARG